MDKSICIWMNNFELGKLPNNRAACGRSDKDQCT